MGATEPRDARRAQIVTGVVAVSNAVGVDDVTVARTAQAAGVSIGAVTHYFHTAEDLLVGAFRAVHDGVLERIDQQTALSEQRDSRIEQVLTDILTQLLPLSPRRRDEVSFTHAVASLSAEDDALLDPVGDAREQILRRVSTALEDGQLCGEVDADLDCEDAASTILELVDALAAQLLEDPAASRRAEALGRLGDAVAQLCPRECHHGLDD